MNPLAQAITKARAAAGKLFSTMDRVPPIDSANDSGEKPTEVFGHITFDVSQARQCNAN
jgi:ATP-binding cassette subfamily B (MDR/TAP) protein 1